MKDYGVSSTRIQDLVRAMRWMEVGELDVRSTAVSTDELGILGRSFNRMVARREPDEAMIQELNTSLGRKVKERAREPDRGRRATLPSAW